LGFVGGFTCWLCYLMPPTGEFKKKEKKRCRRRPKSKSARSIPVPPERAALLDATSPSEYPPPLLRFSPPNNAPNAPSATSEVLPLPKRHRGLQKACSKRRTGSPDAPGEARGESPAGGAVIPAKTGLGAVFRLLSAEKTHKSSSKTQETEDLLHWTSPACSRALVRARPGSGLRSS